MDLLNASKTSEVVITSAIRLMRAIAKASVLRDGTNYPLIAKSALDVMKASLTKKAHFFRDLIRDKTIAFISITNTIEKETDWILQLMKIGYLRWLVPDIFSRGDPKLGLELSFEIHREPKTFVCARRDTRRQILFHLAYVWFNAFDHILR